MRKPGRFGQRAHLGERRVRVGEGGILAQRHVPGPDLHHGARRIDHVERQVVVVLLDDVEGVGERGVRDGRRRCESRR